MHLLTYLEHGSQTDSNSDVTITQTNTTITTTSTTTTITTTTTTTAAPATTTNAPAATNHVSDVRVVDSSPRGSVPSNGPRKQNNGVRLEAKSMYSILHHCIDSVLLLTG